VPAVPEAEPVGTWRWSSFRHYLGERAALFARIRDGDRLGPLVVRMTLFSVLLSALYGLAVGLYAGGWQVAYNTVKMPLLLLATLGLCILALYMLNSLAGAWLSLSQTAAVVLSAVLVTTFLLAAMTPPLAFLMLTSIESYYLVVFLNLVVICIAGAGGVSFSLQATAAVHEEPVVRSRCLRVMRAWMVLYGLVGLQMLWLFRPYFRHADVFIRPLGEGGNAFEAFGRLIVSLLGDLLVALLRAVLH
jgi:hypothetical protein